MSIVRVRETIDRVITASYCIYLPYLALSRLLWAHLGLSAVLPLEVLSKCWRDITDRPGKPRRWCLPSLHTARGPWGSAEVWEDTGFPEHLFIKWMGGAGREKGRVSRVSPLEWSPRPRPNISTPVPHLGAGLINMSLSTTCKITHSITVGPMIRPSSSTESNPDLKVQRLCCALRFCALLTHCVDIVNFFMPL